MVQEKVKNTPLTGVELRDLALHLLSTRLKLHNLLTESQIARVVECFTKDMNNDYAFAGQFMYPQVAVELAIQIHAIGEGEQWAFTLVPEFHFTNPSNPKHTVFIHRPVGIPAPPLLFTPDDEHVVDCFRLTMKVENPNLVRVHLGMPVFVLRTVMPEREKGRPFVSFETEQITYDPHDYDPLPPPIFTDESRLYADQWGLAGAKVEYPTEEAQAWEGQEPLPTDEAPAPLVQVTSEEFEEMMRARKRAALVALGPDKLSDEERAAAEKAAGLHLSPVFTWPEGEPPKDEPPKVHAMGYVAGVEAKAIDPDDAPPKKKAKKRSR